MQRTPKRIMKTWQPPKLMTSRLMPMKIESGLSLFNPRDNSPGLSPLPKTMIPRTLRNGDSGDLIHCWSQFTLLNLYPVIFIFSNQHKSYINFINYLYLTFIIIYNTLISLTFKTHFIITSSKKRLFVRLDLTKNWSLNEN